MHPEPLPLLTMMLFYLLLSHLMMKCEAKLLAGINLGKIMFSKEVAREKPPVKHLSLHVQRENRRIVTQSFREFFEMRCKEAKCPLMCPRLVNWIFSIRTRFALTFELMIRSEIA